MKQESFAEKRKRNGKHFWRYGWNTTPGDNLVEYALKKAGLKSCWAGAVFRRCAREQRGPIRQPGLRRGGKDRPAHAS